jgi:DNA-binding response OmpR family regulator
VVAEDLELQSLLKASLEPAGYAVTAVESGPAALENLSAHSPAGVVLDLSLSRVDGLSLCQAIRRRSQVPMLALSASSEPEQWMAVVEAGADDYLAKPFQVGDLLARTHALLRRAQRWNQPPRRSRLSFEELDIDDHSQQAYRAGQLLELTPTEFELLSYLAHNQGQVLTHGQLINALWPLGQGSRHALFVHINRLRSKIETDPANPHYVVTRWGLGYTFLPRRSSK